MWICSLFPHELIHLLVATILGLFFFLKCRSLKLVLIIFAVTFLLDLDHFFDYFYFIRKLSFREFFSGVNYFIGSDKVFILVHSWELTIVLGIWGWFKRSPVVWAISLAFFGHLLVDQLTYTSNLLAYFLIFRATNNFSLSWFNGL